MAKQNKPAIRFKEFTDAWEQRKFSELYEKVSRKNDLTYGKDDIISVANMYFKEDSYITDESYLLTYNIFELGDIAFEGNKSKNYAHGRFVENTIGNGIVSHVFDVFKPIMKPYDLQFWKYAINNEQLMGGILLRSTKASTMMTNLVANDFLQETFLTPTYPEQKKIGAFFQQLDNLITLHQRKPYSHIQRRCNMLNEAQRTDKFCEYYAKWITVYKKGAIRQVTMDKYLMTQKWLEKLIPDLKICDLNRIAYQQLLNDYAEYHERQTTMDFHHQLKGAVLDAVDEGLIDRDPTRKAIIKGKAPSTKKIKYLNQFELHTLLASLELKDEVNWDYFILLVAKTGMRFSEALALTPKDFDFYHQTLSISKTWDYKGAGGFQPTKNKSSVRKIQIDWQSVIRFSELVKGLPDDQPIFVDGKVYNSTVNDVLSRHCERCNIPVISIHGLRHTHASLLLFTGVSIASVARRLGHSSMTTTQKTYLHIIQELENKDIDLVMRSLSGLN